MHPSAAVICHLRPSVQIISNTGNPTHRFSILTKRCFWVTKSLVSATRLRIQNLRKERAGCPASFSCRHTTIWPWSGVGYTIAALEHSNRVVKIQTRVGFAFGTGKRFVMQQPFPALKLLKSRSRNEITKPIFLPAVGLVTPHLSVSFHSW
jgi:hypothetical protein